MLLPIGHDSGQVRRTPWVTWSLMAACLLVFLYTNSQTGDIERQLNRSVTQALEYWAEHPYLEPPEELLPQLDIGWEEERAGLLEMFEMAGRDISPDSQAREQQKLDEMVARALSARDEHPFFSWGLIPAHPTLRGAFGHMFLHADWMHLLGNLLLLFLTGPFIEDRWGRPIFASFYLLAGLAGGGLFMSRFPEMTGPLIGASGAIYGCLGAFVVRYFRARMQYLLWVFYPFRFWAPAWLMLPFGFGLELLMASATEAIGGSGTAHWAHVGGFIVGVAAAMSIRSLRVEERFVDPRIEEKITLVSNEGVAVALEADAEGRSEEAFELLQREVRRDPMNREAAHALWEIGLAMGRVDQVAPPMLRTLREELRAGDVELAVDHWIEFCQRAPDVPVEPALLLKLVPVLVEREHRSMAATTLEKALHHPELTAAVALRVARTARELDPAVAARAAQRAMECAGSGPTEQAEAQSLLDALGPLVPASPEEIDPSEVSLALEEPEGVSSQASPGLEIPDLEPPDASDPPAEVSLDVERGVPVVAAEPPGPPESAFGGDPTQDFDPSQLAGEPADDLAADVPADAATAAEDAPDLGGMEYGSLELAADDAPPLPSPEETSAPAEHDVEIDPDLELIPAAPAAPALRRLRVMEAAPVRLQEDVLEIEAADGGKRRLALDRVGAVAVAAVRGLAPKSVLIVDLALNWVPDEPDAPLKLVRLRSDRFDPRRLAPDAEAPLDALRSLVRQLLEHSGATPLPDRGTAVGRPGFARFDELVRYERDVLHAESS